MNNFENMRKRLLLRAGLLESPAGTRSMAALAQTEWDVEFEQLMRNRLVMGALRYGPMAPKGMRKLYRIPGLKKRLRQFEVTGNQECLVDIANMALLEFREKNHPKSHWRDLTDDHCHH